MKQFLLSVALAFGISVGALAADTEATMPLPGTATTVLGGGTNKVVAFSTNGPFYFQVSEQTDFTLDVNFKYLNAVGSGDVNGLRLDLYGGISATEFSEDVFLQRNFLANATTTTAKTTITNQPVASISHFKGYFVNISTNAHATNVTLKIKTKPIAVRAR
jgi:hypothetical protein